MMEYFGNPGHFILSDRCRFHITTLVNSKYLVSTVGELCKEEEDSNIKEEWETLSCSVDKTNLYYETMVFDVFEICPCGCGTPIAQGLELDMDRYETAKEANEGHLKMCKKYEMIE